MNPGQAHLIYEFGDFQLDALRRVLASRVDGQPLQVSGKTFDTLLYLVERAGQVIDKRTLLDALWPNVVVEEGNLTQTIHALRRVLGERPSEHRYIVTIAGRGYRFVADVQVREAAGVQPAPPDTTEAAVRERPRRRKIAMLAAASLIVLAVGLFVVLRESAEPPRPSPAPAAPSIAVLPFADMSPEQNQEYFADGLSEEILNLLAQSTALRVIARTSSFSFKGESADIATIASRLDVTHVLEGSVRRSGDSIRITAQLVDAATSAHIWSETYDRSAQDVFRVQSEIAASVADSLQVTLSGVDRPRRGETTSTVAFERYLQGRYFFNRRGPSDLERARGYFEQALHSDPGYARAWAALAGTYFVGGDDKHPISDADRARWHEAVDRAVALGPNLAEAHVRASQYAWGTGNRRVAEEHFKKASALNPSDPLLLGAAATVAAAQGRMEDAISLHQRMLAMDPLSATNRGNLGLHLMAVGRLEEARAEFEKALELSPASIVLTADIGKVLILQQRFDDALVVIQHLPPDYRRDQGLALVYHATGDAPAADAALARLIAAAESANSRAMVALSVAEVFAFRAQASEAFRWLDVLKLPSPENPAVGTGLWIREEMRISTFLKPLHADSRWQTLLADAQE